MNFLKISFGVLLCILVGVICGCGSDSGSGSPAVKKAQKAPASQPPKVVELLMDKTRGDQVRDNTKLPAATGQIDRKDVVILPPAGPGDKPVTQGEIDAARAKIPPVDPNTIEVVPPSQPGGKGLTHAEVEALRPKDEKTQRVEVIPPDVPGGEGVTTEEINRMRAKSSEAGDSQSMEVVPPPTPGGLGLTGREVKRLRPATGPNPKSSPVPPDQQESRAPGKTPASPPAR